MPKSDTATSAATASLPPEIFKAYDIRGIVGKTLTPAIVERIGQAIGSAARARNQTRFVVGRDGRLSGPELVAALARGLASSGCDVIDIGMVPTPVVYFATHHLGTDSGVAVTGSHNPPDYNGLKMVIGGETLSGEADPETARSAARQRPRHRQGSITSGRRARRPISIASPAT